jgi:nicotinamidase-related amidase
MADATPVEPIADAVHLSIDMQNIFAPGGLWETPWMERALPSIEDITARHTTRTLFHPVHHTAACGGSARTVAQSFCRTDRTDQGRTIDVAVA